MPACLLITHGPAAEKLTDSLRGFAKRVESETGVETRFAFLEGEERKVHRVLKEIKEARVLVIPFFVSSGSYHVSEHLPALLKAGGVGKEITLARAFDTSSGLGEIILERARKLSRDAGREALVLLVHGSKDAGRNEKVKRGLEGTIEELRRRSGFAEVGAAGSFGSELEDAVKGLEKRVDRIIVLPLLFFEGRILRERIPILLNSVRSRAEIARDTNALFPHPEIYKWVMREIKVFLKRSEDER